MSKDVIGDRVRTTLESLLINGSSYTKIFPQILVNGKWHYLSDDTTPTKMVECENREEARAKAREARDNAIENGKGAGTE